MSSFRPTAFLRLALLGDAVASGATGLLMGFGAGILTNLLGLPEPLLRVAGLLLLPFAALVALLGTRESVSRGAVGAVIVVNAVWAAGSVLLLFGGWIAPTALGIAFVVFQALVVAGFAEAQVLGLRRSAPAALTAAA